MGFELEGQTAIVTGAARGIGLAISRRLAELGTRVSCWDTDPKPAEDDPAFCHWIEADVTCEESVANAFAQSLAALGEVSILVANAGINGPTKPAWEYSLDEWRRVIEIDLTGVFLSVMAGVRHMRGTGYGRIVVIASVAGKEGNPGACAYGAAKSGVIGFAKGLARELQPSRISINCVAPSMAATDLLKGMSEEYIAEKRSKVPMNRLCSVEEIADMTAWAVSPRCSFTTGQVFDVSGGRATY
ncbi:MAG: SDR family NAD(P)-dependent oxidoreductase [Albidovulum sp.]|nr:SDR family NAD(P)-dependent oxidoreductase [Albidovulum sp.]MDE0530000.1 SDR family NAD(P)-dependent oxidoreductase [Albidovulum sp.]